MRLVTWALSGRGRLSVGIVIVTCGRGRLVSSSPWLRICCGGSADSLSPLLAADGAGLGDRMEPCRSSCRLHVHLAR